MPAPLQRRLRAALLAAAIRTWIGALSRVAPRRAARTAAGLMARIGAPARVRSRDAGVAAQAAASTIAFEGERVAVYRWGPGDAPVVLLAHGWQLRASRLAALVSGLLEAGFAVVAADAVGHGESTGAATNGI